MTVKNIKVFKNKVFLNNKGNLIKFVSKNNLFFKKFGEVYFNEIFYRKSKGWIKHLKTNCLIQCVIGKIQFHFIDHKKKEKKYILKSNSGKIIKIPPNIWFSFSSLEKKSILVNLIENPHKDSEIKKSNIIKNYKIV